MNLCQRGKMCYPKPQSLFQALVWWLRDEHVDFPITLMAQWPLRALQQTPPIAMKTHIILMAAPFDIVSRLSDRGPEASHQPSSIYRLIRRIGEAQPSRTLSTTPSTRLSPRPMICFYRGQKITEWRCMASIHIGTRRLLPSLCCLRSEVCFSKMGVLWWRIWLCSAWPPSFWIGPWDCRGKAEVLWMKNLIHADNRHLRNWYHSAHSTTPLSSLSSDHLFSNKVITEEGNDDKQKTDSKTTGQLPREHTAERSSSSQPLTSAEASSADIAASSELRVHELFALTACFLGPISGAWLLHTIRSQLSRPSEGLVSNYNLTIFLLAAELRPLSHLLKMIQARTLHLQRSLNHSCFTTQFPNGLLSPSIHEISSRLDDLEAYIATFSNKSPTNTKASPELVNSIRKTLQPELDTVTHAIHRYEKHSAVTTLQTQSRLQDLEARLADAITLAAAAERVHHPSSLAGRPGRFTFTFSALVEGVCAVTILPLQIASWIVLLPPRTLRKMKRWMKNKVRKEMRTAGRDKVKVEVLRSDDGGRSRLKEQTSLRGPGNRAKKFM